VAVSVISIFSTSRVSIIVLQEASIGKQATPSIGIAFYSSTVAAQIIFSACSVILIHNLCIKH